MGSDESGGIERTLQTTIRWSRSRHLFYLPPSIIEANMSYGRESPQRTTNYPKTSWWKVNRLRHCAYVALNGLAHTLHAVEYTNIENLARSPALIINNATSLPVCHNIYTQSNMHLYRKCELFFFSQHRCHSNWNDHEGCKRAHDLTQFERQTWFFIVSSVHAIYVKSRRGCCYSKRVCAFQMNRVIDARKVCLWTALFGHNGALICPFHRPNWFSWLIAGLYRSIPRNGITDDSIDGAYGCVGARNVMRPLNIVGRPGVCTS